MPVLSESEFSEKVDLIVERLRNALSPVAIYLFGSYVYGTPNRHSDLDFLVVVEDSPRTAYQRDAAAYKALRGVGVPKDVMFYTRKEFEDRSALPVSFECTVRQKGRILYAA